MHEFSEMYGRLTAGRTIRVYEMADYCQIAPQSLYQILNGKRKPTSVELVQRIADYIQVDPIGREQLLDAYFMTLWGKDVYDRRKEVTNFLNAVHENKSALRLRRNEVFAQLPPTSKVARGSMAIAQTLFDMFFDSEKDPIRLFMPASFSMLPHLVGSYMKENRTLRIEHILELSSKDILFALQNILPMYSSFARYDAYYYYDQRCASTDLFPYYAVSDHALIQIDAGFKTALFHNQEEIVKTFADHFNYQLKIVHPFMVSVSNVQNQLDYFYSIVANAGKQAMVFHLAMSLFPLLTQNEWEIVLPEREEGEAQARIESIQTRLRAAQTMFIFALPAVTGFLEREDISLLTQTAPLTFSQRLDIVKRMIERYRKDGYRMLKDPISTFRRELQWFLGDSNGFLQIIDAQERPIYLNVENPYLLFLFRDYFENIPDRLFYDDEEALDILRGLVEKAENGKFHPVLSQEWKK